jgi:hypothetical protein
MSFWRKATVEQKLAQIDGAIELGMTSVQCARNCGASTDMAVRNFAGRHGRNFPRTGEQARRKISEAQRKASPAASHGSMRRNWERAGFQTANAPSARIFQDNHSHSLFDPVPYEEEPAFA